jgi:hypothetical protein
MHGGAPKAWVVGVLALLFAAAPAAGQRCQDPPGLAPIVADGALEDALRRCAVLDGCRLKLEPRVYPDVAVSLYGGAPWLCGPENSYCAAAGFSRGLVIEGQEGTVLRSPVWEPGEQYQQPRPVLMWSQRSDFGPVVIRNLHIDGRKAEQSAPHSGVQDSSSWLHSGIRFTPQARADGSGTPLCIENVQVSGFLKGGIEVTQTQPLGVFGVRIEDVGCIDGFLPCGVDIPALNPSQDTAFRVAGNGMYLAVGVRDFTVEDLMVRRVSKYAIGLKTRETGEERSIRNGTIRRANVDDTGQIALFVAGVEQVSVMDSRFAGTHSDGWVHPATYSTFGLSCIANVAGLRLRNVLFDDLSGMAVNWSCGAEADEDPDLHASHWERTIVRAACRDRNPSTGYPFPAVSIRHNASGALDIDGLRIDAGGCADDFAVHPSATIRLRRRPAAPAMLDVAAPPGS